MGNESQEDPKKLVERGILTELGDRLENVAALLAENTAAQNSLRESLEDRPTREEVATRRRSVTIRIIIATFWIVVTGAFIVDVHTEQCAARGVIRIQQDLIAGKADLEDFRREAAIDPPKWCGVVFPIHSHRRTGHWPTENNVAGMMLYSTLAIGSVYLIRKTGEKNE